MSNEFDSRFTRYTESFGNAWGMNWRSYMIKRAEKAKIILDAYFCEHPNEEYSILEIGCASGDFTKHILKSISSKAKYVGGDISEEAIRICKENYLGVDNAEFRVMRLPDVELDEQFDIVICMDVIHYFEPDQYEKCLSNMKTLLKKGGQIIVQSPLDYSDENSLIKYFSQIFDIKTKEYVYGKLWYDLVEKRVQPIVQLTYIERHGNCLFRFCGWIGYLILSCKWLVAFSFSFNEFFFEEKRSHIVLIGTVNDC